MKRFSRGRFSGLVLMLTLVATLVIAGCAGDDGFAGAPGQPGQPGRPGQPPAMGGNVEARIISLESKLDRLINHLGVK